MNGVKMHGYIMEKTDRFDSSHWGTVRDKAARSAGFCAFPYPNALKEKTSGFARLRVRQD